MIAPSTELTMTNPYSPNSRNKQSVANNLSVRPEVWKFVRVSLYGLAVILVLLGLWYLTSSTNCKIGGCG